MKLMSLTSFFTILLFQSLQTSPVEAQDLPIRRGSIERSDLRITKQSGLYSHGIVGFTVPRWENGHILAFQEAQEQFPEVVVMNSDGTVVSRVRMTLSDATKTTVRDVARSRNGIVAVTGTAYGPGGTVVPYIAWIDQSGQITQVLRSTPFAATKLVFGSDGTLWAVGREYLSDLKTPQTFDVLRRYTADGRVLQKMLPNTTFAKKRNPAVGKPYVVVSEDRVGVYSAVSGDYIEVSFAGKILGKWQVVDEAVGRVGGVALTKSNQVYVSVILRGAGEPTSLRLLDRGLDEWQTVTLDPALRSRSGTVILGTDGDDLVLRFDRQQSVWLSRSPTMN